MIVTTERSLTVDASVDDIAGWCTSAESRRSWPGVRQVRYRGEEMLYELGLDVPGLPDTTVAVSEQLKSPQGKGDRRRIESTQLWTWPYGEVGTSWTVYAFTARGDATQVDVGLRYTVPGLAGAEVLNRVRFGRPLEAAFDEYVARLATQVSVFKTVVTSATVNRPPGDLVAFFSSPDSRRAWPGVRTASGDGAAITYAVDMRVPGLPEAELTVEERVSEPVQEGRTTSIETVHRWYWPGGDVSNCWLTYRLRKQRRGTHVELVWRYVVPGTIHRQPIDRPRLDAAVGRAAELYLLRLADVPTEATVT